MMNLKETVEKYLALVGEFGAPVPLAAFGLEREETEKHFSALEEDYHISRFLQFSLDPKTEAGGGPIVVYQINGFPQTHLAMQAEIQEIL
jgi:hypothetical protein